MVNPTSPHFPPHDDLNDHPYPLVVDDLFNVITTVEVNGEQFEVVGDVDGDSLPEEDPEHRFSEWQRPDVLRGNSSSQEFNDFLELVSQIQDPKIGFFVAVNSELQATLEAFQGEPTETEENYSFICVDLVNRPYRGSNIPVDNLALQSVDWALSVYARINTDEFYNYTSHEFPDFELQMACAQHFSIRDLIVSVPENRRSIAQMASVISAKMRHGFTPTKFHFHLPIQSYREQLNLVIKNSEANSQLEDIDPMKLWHLLKNYIGYDRRIGVALELDGDLPDEETRDKWLGEAVSLLIIPFGLFLPNRRGGVSMPQIYANFASALIKANARHISIAVKGHIPPTIQPKVCKYLNNLGKSRYAATLVDQFAVGYEDFLQSPLQPLADHLEASTYEIFEKDPVKYKLYFDAMVKALRKFPKDQRVKVLLVGAGRGPLIKCSVNASIETGHRIDLYAVEKNPVTGWELQEREWVPSTSDVDPSTVTVINMDIREWKAPEKADIVISELLGSFSDNELSPECLDGVWQSVKPTAISIPCSYRSLVQPVMSHRLHAEVLAISNQPGIINTDLHYVTHMKNMFPMGKVEPLFEFIHTDLTKPPTERNNYRYEMKHWRAESKCTLHGFAGYFDTVLYDDIVISIVPDHYTEDLISWFPTWIPLDRPVEVAPGDDIILHFWRRVGKDKVWYEWCLEAPVPLRIQNTKGESYFMGLLT